ncbi:MAG: hypothetical protein Q7T25_01945 [Sideroxyarcus sp.]|nr:hypothetical protein [Sideroxyarcus sp.]
MSITAPDLMALAAHLETHPGEAALRGAISRAYYAAFHHAKAWHDSLPSHGLAPQQGGGTHHELANRLISPTLPAGDPRIVISKSGGYLLRHAHGLRVRADYLINDTMQSSDAADAIAKAQSILAKLI